MQTIATSSLGIVLPGGGTRSAYQTGTMIRLAEKGIVPDVVVASSGGAAAGIFPLGGYLQAMSEWAERFDDSRFISWARVHSGPIMSINFLVDGIFRDQAPELEARVSKSSTRRFIAAYCLESAGRIWLTHESVDPLFEQLRATKMMPGVSEDFVSLRGRLLADGCLGASTEDLVDKAFAEGATEVLVIDNTRYGKPSVFTQRLLRWRTRYAPRCVRTAIELYCRQEALPLRSRPHVHVCRARRLPTKHGLVRSSRVNQRSVELGYADADRLAFV